MPNANEFGAPQNNSIRREAITRTAEWYDRHRQVMDTLSHRYTEGDLREQICLDDYVRARQFYVVMKDISSVHWTGPNTLANAFIKDLLKSEMFADISGISFTFMFNKLKLQVDPQIREIFCKKILSMSSEQIKLMKEALIKRSKGKFNSLIEDTIWSLKRSSRMRDMLEKGTIAHVWIKVRSLFTRV